MFELLMHTQISLEYICLRWIISRFKLETLLTLQIAYIKYVSIVFFQELYPGTEPHTRWRTGSIGYILKRTVHFCWSIISSFMIFPLLFLSLLFAWHTCRWQHCKKHFHAPERNFPDNKCNFPRITICQEFHQLYSTK